MRGVRINDAILFVAANMPKETPQTKETINVMTMREIVLKVYRGRFLTSEYGKKVTISQVMTQIATSPTMKLAMYLFKTHSPA